MIFLSKILPYKSEVEMFGVKIYPHYAKKTYTVIEHAKKEIRKVQRLHNSYNVAAQIRVYERANEDHWNLIQTVEIAAQSENSAS